MRRILLLIMLSCIAYAQDTTQSATQEIQSIQDFTIDSAVDTTKDITIQDSAVDSTKDATKDTTKEVATQKPLSELFTPSSALNDTFASFVVGYHSLFKKNEKVKHGIFFAIDKGWGFVDNALLLSISLDGSAGGFYALNLNLKLGGRFLEGRIIPNISLGYEMLNHRIGKQQYNLHGANIGVFLFVDIIKGIGLELGYRAGLYPYHTITKTNIKKYVQSTMLNLKFMDFDL